MKLKKITSLLLCTAMVAGTLTGCSFGKKDEADTTNTQAAVESAQPQAEIDDVTLPSKFSAKKIGNLDSSYNVSEITSGGIIYKDSDNMYGVLSIDQKKDTGAKYARCTAVGDFFLVAEEYLSSTDADSVNNSDLIDGEGNVLISQYGNVEALNSRYYVAYKASGITTDEDEMMFYITEKSFSLVPDEDDVMVKGSWSIYDAENKQFIDGATGTVRRILKAYGNYAVFTTDDNVKHAQSGDGKVLENSDSVFKDGSYKVEEGNNVVIYDADDSKLFSVKANDYVPTKFESGKYIATKSGGDGTSYVVMDRTGKVISSEFDSSISVYGNLVESQEKLFDFSGKTVTDESVKSAIVDEDFGAIVLAKCESRCLILTADGGLLKSTTDDVMLRFPLHIQDGGDICFSVKDKDFTINGIWADKCDFLAVVKQTNDTKSIINLITNETVIEGYSNYYFGGNINTALYVCAKNASGESDIYQITAE